ncbi:MAG: elongin C [Amphiamblys sp. WSBS2006]|nr:MAG: elongin C [Amphiamblys sp. WSBS2006]
MKQSPVDGLPQLLPESVELVSSDGVSFFVSRDLAACSKLLSALLTKSLGAGAEGETIETCLQEALTQKIHLTNISSEYLEVVVEYMEYRLKWNGTAEKNVPEFVFPQDMAVDLLLIADFLQI